MSGVPGWVVGVPVPRGARFQGFGLRSSSVVFMAYGRPLPSGRWRGGRGNWRNEANWWREWLSFLGARRYGASSARCAGKRGALRVARCFAKLSHQRIPRVRDGPRGGLGWGVVTQGPEPVCISRVGISHFPTMGCGHGERFCVASRSIAPALPGGRRDLGLSAGFWAVQGGDGLACDRGRAGGVLGCGAVGFDLTLSGHRCLRGNRLRTCPTLRIEERLREFVGK
jgi:hypothetical protein